MHPMTLPSVEDELKLRFKIRDQAQKELNFLVKISTPFAKIMETYTGMCGTRSSLQFTLKGQPVKLSDTPALLGMQEDDIISVQQTHRFASWKIDPLVRTSNSGNTRDLPDKNPVQSVSKANLETSTQKRKDFQRNSMSEDDALKIALALSLESQKLEYPHTHESPSSLLDHRNEGNDLEMSSTSGLHSFDGLLETPTDGTQPTTKRLKVELSSSTFYAKETVLDNYDKPSDEPFIIEDEDGVESTLDANIKLSTSLAPSIHPLSFPLFIGECTVLASAMCTGSKIINAGDTVLLRFTPPYRRSPFSSRKNTPSSSAQFGSMFKPSIKSSSIDILRIYLERNGKEVGKLDSENSKLFCNLLRREMIQLKGTIIFSPEKISMLSELVVSISIELKGAAFVRAPSHSLNPDEQESEQAQVRTFLSALFVKIGFPLKQKGRGTNNRNVALTEEDRSLTSTELSNIYRKASAVRENAKHMKPASGMNISLHKYQEAALSFLVGKERSTLTGESVSPLWSEYEGTFQGGRHNGKFYYNCFSGLLSTEKPLEAPCVGGILADEMGLGKTIEILALIHTNRMQESLSSKSDKSVVSCDHSQSSSTLIICPLNLLSQWRDEIVKCFKPDVMSHELYYGSGRCHGSPKWADIVITTYGTLAKEAEPDKRQSSPLYNTSWYRIVLDEAHFIKDSSTKVAKSCFSLDAQMRWAVTGTPIVNKIEDLFALLHFLRVEPWGSFSYFNSFVSVPFKRKQAKALDALQSILENLVIRRTKDMQGEDGRPLVELPLKTVSIKRLSFSEEEAEIYASLNTFSRKRLATLKFIGKADYLHVFKLLLRMRQFCDHPLLLRNKTSSTEPDEKLSMDLETLLAKYASSSPHLAQVVEDMKEKGKECPLCLDEAESGVLLDCFHFLCRSCLEDYLAANEESGRPCECPLCRKEFSTDALLKVTSTSLDFVSQGDSPRKINIEALHYPSSAKIKELVKDLKLLQLGIKSIVFSQWTSMLDLVEVALAREGISLVRLDGSLSQKARQETIASFNNEPGVRVLIASLRATGVGLNLTAASQVFLLDPWWNYSVEMQSMDRCHRLGQTREVIVTRYIIKDSVEEKILKIQERKMAIAGAFGGGKGGVSLDELLNMFD